MGPSGESHLRTCRCYPPTVWRCGTFFIKFGSSMELLSTHISRRCGTLFSPALQQPCCYPPTSLGDVGLCQVLSSSMTGCYPPTSLGDVGPMLLTSHSHLGCYPPTSQGDVGHVDPAYEVLDGCYPPTSQGDVGRTTSMASVRPCCYPPTSQGDVGHTERDHPSYPVAIHPHLKEMWD